MHAPVNKQQADLLHDFGSNLGLALAFDNAGQCLMMVDEAMIAIQARDQHFVFHGTLGAFSQTLPSSFWKYLLSLNTVLTEQGGGAITLELDTDTLALFQRIDVSTLSAGQLSAALRDFVDQMNDVLGLLDRAMAVSNGVESMHHDDDGARIGHRADDLFHRLA